MFLFATENLIGGGGQSNFSEGSLHQHWDRKPLKLFYTQYLYEKDLTSMPGPLLHESVLYMAGTMRTVPIQLGRCGLMLSIVLTLASATPQKVYLDMNSTTVGTGTEDGEDVFTGPTYSVIVVASNPRPSNQFRDEKRVRCFNTLSGGRDVVSVQFGDPSPDKPPGIDEPPFGARHADGVSKRVRLIFRADVNGPSDNQVRIYCVQLQDVGDLPKN